MNQMSDILMHLSDLNTYLDSGEGEIQINVIYFGFKIERIYTYVY